MIESSRKAGALMGRIQFHFRAAAVAAICALALLLSLPLRADEPYARTRDYDLQHSKIILKFDIDQRKVIGDVTHSISILRDNTSKVSFDSVGLTIGLVSVHKSPAKYA